MRKKTIIVGMNNPYSDDPELALWPSPLGCAGHRLWQMLRDRCQVTRSEYCRAFERVNLVTGDWDRNEARCAAEARVEMWRNRRVILLGSAVRSAFRLPPLLVEPVLSRGVYFRQLPHPSGRCRWYNDPKNRAIAGMVLEEEMRR